LAFTISGLGAYAVFWYCRKNKDFAPAYLAGLIGVVLGFFVYRWTFQLFWDSTVVLLCIVAAFSLTLGVYAYCHAFKLILPITSGLGSLMLLRGISSLIGGFPEDFSSFTGSTLGLMSTFYYLMAWILLFVFGF